MSLYATVSSRCPACGWRHSMLVWVLGRMGRERYVRCLQCGDLRPEGDRRG